MFTRADANDIIHGKDKDFPIADAPGLGGLFDRFDHIVKPVVGNDDLKLHLGQKVHDVFRPAVQLGMPFFDARIP